MLKARLAVLPPEHPAAVLFHIALGNTLRTWVTDVSALQARTSFCNSIPDITSCYSADEIVSVQLVPAERKRLLRAYKHFFVRS